LTPTWRNNPLGDDGISKRIEFFVFVFDVVLEKVAKIRSQVGPGGIPNHSFVIL
jgi:hypothetical protein